MNQPASIVGQPAASYARFSSDLQSVSSLIDQQRECRQRATRDGAELRLELEFSDAAVSGTKRDRLGLDTMLQSAARGAFKVLYLYSLSRLARESVITMPLLKDLVERLRRPLAPLPRLIDVFAELRQLESEFDDFAIDLKLRTVSAVVGPVVLEGVRLGRFRLTLDVGRLEPDSHDGCFLVDALEPNPAAGERNITHPHVSDGRVCAGEAEIPFAAALRQGRLFDAFALLRAVLNHYAPDSPYVPLKDWGGVNCPECGKSGPADELTSCMSCRREVCNDCSSYCRCCDTTRCDDCLEPCEVCRLQCCGGCLEELDERNVCEHCRKACKECGDTFATDRLDRTTGLCKGCRESAEDEAA